MGQPCRLSRKVVRVVRFELTASRFQGEPSTGLTIHPVMVGRGREVFMVCGLYKMATRIEQDVRLQGCSPAQHSPRPAL